MQYIKRFSHTIKYKVFENVTGINHKKNQLSVCNIIYRRSHNSNDFLDAEEDKETDAYMQLANQYLGIAASGHNCFVIQPYVKWGKEKKRITTPELQLEEAVALVNTLSNWTVIDKMCVPLLTLSRKQLLGSGKLESLKQTIRRDERITAIFISTNTLRHAQICELQKIFRIPVYDRYSIVIQIFREHAKSPEAKLQVALAELPYVWSKMRETNGISGGHITPFETRKWIIQTMEKNLKQKLAKLKDHRQIIRKQRKVHGYPSIAVVGYTNAGKTSLIKTLTGDTSLQPENKLFATLDTTVHAGFLPCRLKVLYLDTIGFIQDIPETLIEPFKVTLEDAMIADVIVHVYDISHPDIEAQVQHVRKTIEPMIGENKPVIEVANKCDLLTTLSVPSGALAVSSVNTTGIDTLRSQIEEQILAATGRKMIRIKVKSGSSAASWLYKNTTVINAVPNEENPQVMIMEVLATEEDIHNFKRYLKQ